MRPSTPLDEFEAVWTGERERLVASARVLVVGPDARQAERLAASLRPSGLEVEVAAGISGARAAAAAKRRPDLRLVAFSGAEDPLAALLVDDGRGVDRPSVAVASSRSAAAEAMALGADDVLLKPLAPERAAARVRARLRQSMTVRLLERLGDELRADAAAGGGQDETARALEAVLEEHGAWLRDRGARLLLAWGDPRLMSQAVDVLAPLGHAVLTAEHAGDVREILLVAGVDVALVHAGLPGGVDEAVRTLRGNDALLQVAMLETSGLEGATDRGLEAGAVTALRLPELGGGVLCAVVQSLVAARRWLAMHERVVLELGNRRPETVARWRAARAQPADAALDDTGVAPAGAAAGAAAATGAARADGAPARAKADLFADRRHDPRIPMSLPVLVLPRDPPGAVVRGTTLNLSLGGAFVECATTLRPGQEVECKVMVGDTTVYLDGAVVRAGEGSNAEGRLVPGFAVRFDRVAAGTVQRLAQAVRTATRR